MIHCTKGIYLPIKQRNKSIETIQVAGQKGSRSCSYNCPKYTHIHKHTHKPFYGSVEFFRDNPGEPVPEETFIHSHLSWSSIVPYMLPPSITIYGILPVQSTHLTIFFHKLCQQYKPQKLLSSS